MIHLFPFRRGGPPDDRSEDPSHATKGELSLREKVERRQVEVLSALRAKLATTELEELPGETSGPLAISKAGPKLSERNDGDIPSDRAGLRLAQSALHPKGLKTLTKRSIAAARELHEEAQARGIVPSGRVRFQREPLSMKELSQVQILCARTTGLSHLLALEAAGMTDRDRGGEDKARVHKSHKGIVVSQSDGGGGIPFAAEGAELFANSAALHASELMQRHKGSLRDPKFLGELHSRVYADTVAWMNVLGLDPQHAHARALCATTQLTLVNQQEVVVLAIGDGYVDQGNGLVHMNDTLARKEKRLFVPPMLSSLLLSDAGQRILRPREFVEDPELGRKQLEGLAYEARGYHILAYGESRDLLEGQGVTMATDGVRMCADVKQREGFFCLPLSEVAERHPDDLDDILALVNLSVDMSRHAEQYEQAYGSAWKEYASFTGVSLVEGLLHHERIAECVRESALSEVEILLTGITQPSEKAPVLASARNLSTPELWRFIRELDRNEAVLNELARIDRGAQGDQFTAEKMAESVTELMMPKVRHVARELLRDQFDLDPGDAPIIFLIDDICYHRIRLASDQERQRQASLPN